MSESIGVISGEPRGPRKMALEDGGFLYEDEGLGPYEGTRIETIYSSNAADPEAKFALGIVDFIGDVEYGQYADCGIVHKERKR